MNSVITTNAPNIRIAVQLVGLLLGLAEVGAGCKRAGADRERGQCDAAAGRHAV